MQSQDTPLIFSLDQAGQLRGLQGSQEGMQVSTLRLPSGTKVPHSQIVNQVTDHFSINRNLESGSVTLRLHPAELGELRMEIKVEQDNIKAHITTHNPQVQDILDRNIPKLREVLEQQGMNLEHIQVTVAADDGGSGQLFQEQFEQNRFNRNLRRNAHQMDFAISEEEMDIPVLDSDEQSLSVHA
jgi:flagellar hook-length control protein FliK